MAKLDSLEARSTEGATRTLEPTASARPRKRLFGPFFSASPSPSPSEPPAEAKADAEVQALRLENAKLKAEVEH